MARGDPCRRPRTGAVALHPVVVPERRVAPREISEDWASALSDLIAAAPVNLVSRRDRPRVRQVHVDEAIAVARSLRLGAGSRWMDLGTGGGLPGLVLGAAFPSVSWTLLDARGKKVTQVERFAETLGLENVQALHARAEDLSATVHVGGYDGVVSRAAGSLAQTAILARPFVTDGEIVAIRGPQAADDVAAARKICGDLGLLVEAVEQISGTIRPTWLVRLRGPGPVPTNFPRTQRALLRAARGGSSDGSS